MEPLNSAEKKEEYIVHIPPSFSVMTRQRVRAAEREMTYTYRGDQRLCEFVPLSKRTRSKRKRALKRKERGL
jgi:lipid II:glycine glycyltransferase (peptidoglycan interpeptide bridge formation enzyme)